MRYEFECRKCGETREVLGSLREYETGVVQSKAQCCGCLMEQEFSGLNFALSMKTRAPGDTGFHNLDYGKNATWDLTKPGKMERLKRLGVIKDPWDNAPPERRNLDVDL